MRLKRIFSGVLALALVACLLPFAAPAARAASFSDISDAKTAENVEVLRMMGVVDGTGGSAFQPNGTLSRAQFAKMSVVMLGKKGAVGQYQTYTIFPDVRASHWAAGYVNLAVKGDSEGKDKLLTGYPDGRFHPDEQITFGQTVTILMRMLGYQDGDVGAVWPQGYLNAASTIGLTDGVKLSANAKVTRAQAAQLFCNLLNTEQKDGGSIYANKLGTLVPDSILLSVSATASDGSKNAIKTTEKTYKVADRAADASLAGRKGTLVLDSSGRALTFIPEKNTSFKAITVSDVAQDALTDSSGRKYEINSGVTAYFQGEKKTYGDVQPDIREGMAVTLYFDGAGDLDYLFVSGSVSDDAVIVGGQGSTLGFERLTDSKNYTIYKNGVPATEADLRPYDAATYDAATNTIRVSDTKLSGYYADAKPNTASPTKITMMGREFTVLPCAASSLVSFKIGQQVTLLLTEDGQVAGAADPGKVRGNAVGIATSVSENAATVALFCGLTIQGDPKLGKGTASQYEGQLVKVSSYQKGNQISLSRITSGGVRGNLDVAKRTVGGVSMADNIRIYDKVGSSKLVKVKLSDIPANQSSASKVLYAEKDYAGRINVLVLDNATGDAYTYGKCVVSRATKDEDGNTIGQASIKIEYGNDKESPTVETGTAYRNGEYGGLAFYGSQSGSRIASVARMTELDKVPNSAWNGTSSVTVKGVTYAVPDSVVCYNETTGRWLSVTEARSFANTATLYYDSIGEKIRIVVVK